MAFECIAPPLSGKLLPFVVVTYRDGQRVITSDALASAAQVDAFFDREDFLAAATDEPRERAKQLLAERIAQRGWQAHESEYVLEENQHEQ